jgi:hypothetical protein
MDSYSQSSSWKNRKAMQRKMAQSLESSNQKDKLEQRRRMDTLSDA